MNKIKKELSVILIISMILCGCSPNAPTSSSEERKVVDHSKNDTTEVQVSSLPDAYEEGDPTPYEYVIDFDSLNNEELWSYIEQDVYLELAEQLNSEDYFIESVKTKYISQEYIDEMAYNSLSNVYFGYTLEDLDKEFDGTRYVFTLGENGETVVTEMEGYDDTYERIIKNVAIGTGVILVCVTVSVLTGGVGTGTISIIFAGAAEKGTVFALSSAAIGGFSSAAITGITTGDMNQALKVGAIEASEGFKWGAIIGAVTGGISEAGVISKFKNVDLNMPLKDAVKIQKESNYPVEIIKQFHNMDEYKVFKEAGLKAYMINGKTALIRNIDLTIKDEFGRTNLERMKLGLAALDANGKPYELHHIGQEAKGALAILTQAEHDNAVLHGFKEISEIDRAAFDTVRKQFWKEMANVLSKGL
ncbi:MAG: HNH/ENDO VII family nuclease [Lachnospiraceae bacterium]|nr:HNH/ENDO VII family nuclease [Lachnospiraceae bacterium]